MVSDEEVEQLAAKLYWDWVDPNLGSVRLSIAVLNWPELVEDNRDGRAEWLCKAYWRTHARNLLEERVGRL